MSNLNILNKRGYLTDEDRKQPLERGCEYFTFKTNLDLSIPVKVIPYGLNEEIPSELYSRDLSSFIAFWTRFVSEDLNGFSGFHNVKFEFVGFKLV